MKYRRNSNYIPAIHNYCDRWCERCYFTSRCAIYENTGDLTLEETDANNKAFWNRISENLSSALTMIKKEAEKQGIDLDNIPEEEIKQYQKKEKDLDKQIKKHPVSKLSLQYITEGTKLLNNNDWIKDEGKQLIANMEMGIVSPEQTKEKASLLKDCLEIVHWYIHFIHVKFQRALHGKLEGEELAEKYDFPKDSDGSAKIALIAIDRSVEAWIKLTELLPANEDSIIYLLALLQKLQKAAEAEFPDARKFIRPGFDEPDKY